ncbi:hypothetical protein [Pseudophaeobacter sp. EL27]|uniref:hypothetical protein n=1 Tax=Pseudophaeobacter sp. EL27 TaxID=2107580 RepID=UPI0013C51B85|nr:hypothetical protein [Pseudophaeobacter sp. EL27]
MLGAASVFLGSEPPCGGAATCLQQNRQENWPLDDRSQPKADRCEGRLLLIAAHAKMRLDFPEADIQAVRRGFLPSMSASSPDLHCGAVAEEKPTILRQGAAKMPLSFVLDDSQLGISSFKNRFYSKLPNGFKMTLKSRSQAEESTTR